MHGHFATDLGDLDDRYELLDRFGQGMCGSVLQARRRSTGELVAIKMLVYEDDCADGVPAHIIREVCLLRDFTHPNVVQLLEVQVVGAAQYNLVFEHVDHDLHRELKAYRAEDRLVPLRTLLEYSRGLLQGVQACHLRQVVHRNLKPQNILVAEEGLKICDFGLARLFEPTHRAYTGSVVSLWPRLGRSESGLWVVVCSPSDGQFALSSMVQPAGSRGFVRLPTGQLVSLCCRRVVPSRPPHSLFAELGIARERRSRIRLGAPCG